MLSIIDANFVHPMQITEPKQSVIILDNCCYKVDALTY